MERKPGNGVFKAGLCSVTTLTTASISPVTVQPLCPCPRPQGCSQRHTEGTATSSEPNPPGRPCGLAVPGPVLNAAASPLPTRA